MEICSIGKETNFMKYAFESEAKCLDYTHFILNEPHNNVIANMFEQNPLDAQRDMVDVPCILSNSRILLPVSSLYGKGFCDLVDDICAREAERGW